MTQAAMIHDSPPELASLIAREFSPDCLSATLGLGNAVPERVWHRALAGPLCELASREGKALRARLVEIAWEMGGGRGETPPELTAIVEALHLGSLIIDDIEDGSVRRRGGPALHHIVGLPLALNAGNWLYFWPSTLLGRLHLSGCVELALRRAIDDSVLRCHYGQALDLSVRVTELRQREVLDVVDATARLKTGSLLELAARVGAIAAGGEAAPVNALGRLGSELGVALQMVDDLSGLTVERRCHKGHEDLLAARATWPWVWLAENTDPVAYCRLRALAEGVVARDVHPEHLAQQIRACVAELGKKAISTKLDAALQSVAAELGEPRGLSKLREDLSRLEAYGG
jgi:geranylgeranyl pyrophosphate synthase